MFRRIYLDHSATTPVDDRVLTAMFPFFNERFGNASSIHHFGQDVRSSVDRARHQVAALMNARPNEVIFTSGGTESNNLAVRGIAEMNSHHGRHIVTSNIEHPAVGAVCDDLESRGFDVTRVAVKTDGLVSFEDVRDAIRDDTILVSVMLANNEIGTIQPVEDIGKHIRDLRTGGSKIWFHTDAVQAAGKIPIDVESLLCDLLTISGHKIYAPKGVGALYVRRGTRIRPQNIGGRQERGLRGGTENVPAIVGFGEACAIAADELVLNSSRIEQIRNTFEDRIAENIDGIEFNGDRRRRIPTISNISFAGVEGEALLINLDMRGIAASTGSACSSGSLEPSPVVRALGKGDDIARTAMRFSFGCANTNEDLETLLEELPKAVAAVRSIG